MSQSKTKPIAVVVSAFEEFVKSQSFGGFILVICMVVAFIWANSSLSASYFDLRHIYVGLHAGNSLFHLSLQHWVNDGLMAIFFLLVGLEIKRELLYGELSDLSKASLPIVAAVGGMVFPAIIFIARNYHHPDNLVGWAIPMATDIAFALGVLSLLGKRVPKGLVIFLSAVAIVDDLGAVLVIAIFYSASLSWLYLSLSLLVFILLLVLNYCQVRRLLPYLLLGVFLWVALLHSGIHATIAGVLLAFAIPGRETYSPQRFLQRIRALLNRFSHADTANVADSEHRKDVLNAVEGLMHEVETPLQRLEHMLHIPVTYFIVPIFVLFNAGISLAGIRIHEVLFMPLTFGIAIALIFGKVLGIFGVSMVFIKLGWARLPQGVKLKQLFPLSLMAGIGFTMSIFIAELAFPGNQQAINLAKIGILGASLIAAVLGFLIMKLLIREG